MANLEVSGEIPDWLKTGEGAETKGEERDKDLPEWAKAAQQSGEEWQDEEAPTLDDVSGDHKPTDDLPIWLIDEELPDTIFTGDKSTDELFGAQGAEADAGKKRGTAEELPDWLQGLASGTGPLPTLPPESDSLEREDEEQGSSSEMDRDQDSVPADASPDETAGSLQDWLSGVETEVSEESTASAEMDVERRANLEGMPPAEHEDRTTGEPAEETIPEWLADLEGEPADTEAAAPDPTGNVEAEDRIPDWLANLQAGSPEVEEPEETVHDDWLADLEAEAAPGETEGEEVAGLDAYRPDREESSELETEDVIPGWLAAFDAKSSAPDADISTEPETEEEDFPDWLASLDIETGESAPIADTSAFADEDRLPDWLREADEAERAAETAAEAEDTPAWLEDADVEAPAEAELPEWLMGTEAAASLRSTTEEEEESGEAPEVDWERAEQPAEAPAEQPAEVPVEVPEEEPAEEPTDWLSELGILESDDSEMPSTGATPTTEMPEWLRQMAPPQTGSLVPPEETAPVSEDLDDFLSDLDSEELPEWLTEGGAEPIEEPAAGELPAADELDEVDEGALPSRFSAAELTEDELSFSEVEEAIAADPATEAQPEETLPPEPPREEEAEEIMESFVPTNDLPEWLGDVMFDIDESEAFAFDEEEEAGVPLPPSAEVEGVPEALAGEELPAWLEDSFPENAEGEFLAEPTPLEELPEWLRPPGGIEGVSPAEDDKWGDLLNEIPPAEESEPELSEAEIPEWLRALKPRELLEEREADEVLPEQAPESGPLARLRGVIAIEPVIAEAQSARRVSDYTVSKEQQQQAALLQQLVRTVPQEAVQVGATKAREGFPLLQVFLALLLLTAMVTGFFVPTLVEPEPAATGLTEAQTLVSEAAPLPVLVVFDYTPAMAGALDTHASLLLEEIAASGSPILIASQSAAGLTLADQKVAEIFEGDSQRVGYIPGGPVGLRRLASCLEESAACESIFGQPLSAEVSDSLAKSALIVVMAGDQESVISWIEQVAANTDKPMLAVVPQAVAPVAAPYYASEQLAGLLSGSRATLVAEMADEPPFIGDGAGQVTALALAQWLAIGLLLVGNLFYLVSGSLRGGREGTA